MDYTIDMLEMYDLLKEAYNRTGDMYLRTRIEKTIVKAEESI